MTDDVLTLPVDDVGGGDELQRLCVVIPCYVNVPTTFMQQMLTLLNAFDDVDLLVMRGPYVAQSMRMAVQMALEKPDWRRMLVIEQDMVIPPDTLIKHSLHTDDIVGSMYFQHAPPFYLNMMIRDPSGQDRYGHPPATMVRDMLERPALWKCDIVGLGCTSIARRVFEDWPTDTAVFRNEYHHDAEDYSYAHGEVSHDVYFCKEARRLGFNIYTDSSIVCQHITEGATSAAHYMAYHKKELESKIVVPNRAARRAAH